GRTVPPGVPILAAYDSTLASGGALKPTRAVTAADYEALAFETPGVTLARVGVRPNLHPGFPCWDAPGVVTVIILPHLPAGRPEPSCETIRQVAAYLARRRIVGTRIEVVGPTYRTVAVQASVRACQGERP